MAQPDCECMSPPGRPISRPSSPISATDTVRACARGGRMSSHILLPGDHNAILPDPAPRRVVTPVATSVRLQPPFATLVHRSRVPALESLHVATDTPPPRCSAPLNSGSATAEEPPAGTRTACTLMPAGRNASSRLLSSQKDPPYSGIHELASATGVAWSSRPGSERKTYAAITATAPAQPNAVSAQQYRRTGRRVAVAISRHAD